MFLSFFACSIFLIIKYSYGANILIADSVPSPSHQIFNYAIAELLLDRGHNVTMLGPLTIKPLDRTNYTYVPMEGLHQKVMESFGNFPDATQLSLYTLTNAFLDYSYLACKFSYESDGIKQFFNSYPKNYKFDAIIIDLTVDTCFLPLIQRFNYPPTVAITAFLIPHYLVTHMGGNIHPAFIPSYNTQLTDEMTFFQRVYNYYAYVLELVLRNFVIDKKMVELFKSHLGNDVDSVEDLRKHVDLLLVNWNPLLHYPQTVPPNTIPIAGVHVKTKPIEKELKKILDDSKDGVILFSLGSNLQSSDLTPEVRSAILSAFSQIKETVLWKFETDIVGLPKNVIVRKWIPQSDVLAHPNTKLFISHAGGLSTIEATYFGVPVLGMPFFADQHNNIDTLIKKGLSKKIYHATLTTENFLETIREMLQPKYRKGMKELSLKFHDQPQEPKERAAFWIEYAIKHNGAKFLSPKSRYLPLIVSSCTDVHLLIVAVFLITIFILHRIVKYIVKPNVKSKEKTH